MRTGESISFLSAGLGQLGEVSAGFLLAVRLRERGSSRARLLTNTSTAPAQQDRAGLQPWLPSHGK